MRILGQRSQKIIMSIFNRLRQRRGGKFVLIYDSCRVLDTLNLSFLPSALRTLNKAHVQTMQDLFHQSILGRI
jgi:hypothetical protein